MSTSTRDILIGVAVAGAIVVLLLLGRLALNSTSSSESKPAKLLDDRIEVIEDTPRCVTCYVLHYGEVRISCVARCLHTDGGAP